jgi:hypothetical protein
MPRMTAPEGVTSYSHNGFAFEVGEDGTIEVDEHVAAPLRHHGFKDIHTAAPPSENVSVKREDLLVVFELLGIAANPAMRADKLAAVLTTAIKAKDAKRSASDNKNKGAA